jgi:hypothetical protein
VIVTVSKIGTGTESDPLRPNTSAECWQVIEEKETEFVIEVLD